jgi:hypothetical protein
MILDMMTYSAMTIVAVTSFVVILLASSHQDQQGISST